MHELGGGPFTAQWFPFAPFDRLRVVMYMTVWVCFSRILSKGANTRDKNIWAFLNRVDQYAVVYVG
jgi:hypothetical protein